jgi:serine protease Do
MPTAAGSPAALSTGVGTRRLLGLLAAVALIAITPSLVGQIAYQVRYNELLAGVDVADQGLKGLKSRLSDFELTSRLISKRLEPSVVSIFRPGPRGREGQGSGVIVDKAGYIVTNYHVVRGARKIEVQLSDGRRAPVTDVKTDEMTDLAVLKIDLPDLVAAEWGDSDQLEVGDLVWAVGSPFGLDRSVTFGIVSAKARRSGSRLTTNLYQEYLQTDAAVNPGNSGGPLINIEGKIVGINAAIFGPAYQGISFAIPSSVAHEQYTQLRDKGWIERAWLGIRPESVPPNVQERLGLSIGEGVYVNHVEVDAPAGRAGIQAGDVILQWNDFEATDATLLSRAIAATKVGSKATVRLVRGQADPEGEPQRTQLQFEVDVERHPESISPKDDRR